MQSRYDQLSPIPPLTKVTKVLIIICTASFFIDFILSHLGFQIGGLSLNEVLGLVPAYVRDRYWFWQLFTYIFMHGHPFHLLLNMLILWYFGSEIEMRLGEKNFLLYFFITGIGAGLCNLLINLAFVDETRLLNPIIGASGVVYGLLAAYAIFFGNRYFLVFFLFPMKAKYFVLILAGIELVTGVDSRGRDNVAHFAHLGGLCVGALYIYLRYVKPWSKGSSKKDNSEKK
jgi:membrane associated rhomboid family serine protease